MRRVISLSLLLATVAVASACSREEKPPGSKAFCNVAERWDKEIQRTQLQGKAEVKRQLPIIEDLNATAPEGIAADTQVFLDAMQRLADGDRSVVDDPEIKAAVDNVNRYTNKACNVYERDSGL
jgi:hypothetical protein